MDTFNKNDRIHTLDTPVYDLKYAPSRRNHPPLDRPSSKLAMCDVDSGHHQQREQATAFFRISLTFQLGNPNFHCRAISDAESRCLVLFFGDQFVFALHFSTITFTNRCFLMVHGQENNPISTTWKQSA